MKIFLFGGAEVKLGQVEPLLKLIQRVIKKLKVKQVLHIPFARTKAKEAEWSGDWFHRHIHLKGVRYFNAATRDDFKQARSPLIFLSGGNDSANLLKKIKSNPQLLSLINQASYIIGESAGAKVLAAYFRSESSQGKRKIIRGLGIIKNTIIEPHYSERNRQKLLVREMKQCGARYGIGIDCVTGLEFELNDFPKKYKKIGKGSVRILNNPF